MSAKFSQSYPYLRRSLIGIFALNAIALFMGVDGCFANLQAALTAPPMERLPGLPKQTIELAILLMVLLFNLVLVILAHRLMRQPPNDFELEAHLASQLSLSEERLTGILEIAGDAIISLDQKQKIILYNQAAEKIFGYSAAEVMGHPLDLLIPDRFIPIHRQHIQHFGHGQSASRQMSDRPNIFGKRQDGSEFPAEASVSRLLINDDIIYTVILRDISERRYIEQLKDEFISIVSHELRTPVTAVYGPLKILATGLINSSSEQGQQLLQIATTNADRLVNLINDILDLESLDQKSRQLSFSRCHVLTLLNEVMQLQQPYAHNTGVELRLEVTPELAELFILANHDRVIRVLINLLNNAIQFSPMQGIVWLRVAVVNQQVQFSVQDQGHGIPAEKVERIFDRFQQVDSSSTRNHEGSGLGLAICRGIVQQHQGKIWLESKLGEGSTFYFTMPILMSSEKQSL